MFSKISIRQFIKNDWIIGLFLLGIFLATNGYIYAWDDQHLEIPLLKSLIDPSLYVGDYYVESLKKNFISVLYPLLAKIISLEQIPATYFILYLISRYFLFYWMYKIWKWISGDQLTGVLCTAVIMLLGRVEEFLYRTFSHQELALAIIMAGIYCFYRNRYVLAAAIFGIAANFHALYSLFPFLYMEFFLVKRLDQGRLKVLLKTAGAFLVSALPFLLWTLFRYTSLKNGGEPVDNNWLDLYHIACPQNFIFHEHALKDMFGNFTTFLDATLEYWVLLVYYVLNLVFNKDFRKDEKSQSIIQLGFALLVLSFVFSYIFPIRFILDLNLIRNAQFLLFILMGYTTILVVNTVKKDHLFIGFLLALLFPVIRFGRFAAVLVGMAMILILAINFLLKKKTIPKTNLFIVLFSIGLIFLVWQIIQDFLNHHYSLASIGTLWCILAVVVMMYVFNFFIKDEGNRIVLKNLFVILPLVFFTFNYIYYHVHRLQIERTGEGFWQMQRNWIDMQQYVRQHTPKDALIMIPYDMEMGGFRIFSEREVVCCYRDCGIIGFNYSAAKEWEQRIKDIEPFKVIIDGSIEPAVKNAILKYKANYIIFMRYIDPGANPILEDLYKNEVFALYKIKTNSIEQ